MAENRFCARAEQNAELTKPIRYGKQEAKPNVPNMVEHLGNEMKKCSYCGKEYADNMAVCAFDGLPLFAVGSECSGRTRQNHMTSMFDLAKGSI